jgi:hypothetical protein
MCAAVMKMAEEPRVVPIGKAYVRKVMDVEETYKVLFKKNLLSPTQKQKFLGIDPLVSVNCMKHDWNNFEENVLLTTTCAKHFINHPLMPR